MRNFVLSFLFLASILLLGCSDYNVYYENYIIDLNFLPGSPSLETPQSGVSTVLPNRIDTIIKDSKDINTYIHYFTTNSRAVFLQNSINASRVNGSTNDFIASYTQQTSNPAIPNTYQINIFKYKFDISKKRKNGNSFTITTNYNFLDQSYNPLGLRKKTHVIHF